MGVRSSMAKADLIVMTGFGKLEGIARVSDPSFVTVQHQLGEKKGGGLVTPYFALRFNETYVDSDLKLIDADAPAEVHDIVVCWGRSAKKNDQGVETSPAEPIMRFWPANGKSGTDAELIDIGMSDIQGEEKLKLVEIGAEGNTMVSVDGAAPFANSDLGVFMAQLELKGFSAELNGQGYAPNYDGLVYEFKTTEKKDVYKKLGLSYEAPKNPRKDNKGNVLADVCREITNVLVRPYEKKAGGAAKPGGGAKAGAAAAKPGATGAGAGAVASTTTTAASAPVADDPRIDEIFTKFTTDNKGKEYANKGKLLAGLGAVLIQAIGMTSATAYTNKVKAMDADAFAALGMEFGFTFDGTKVTID